MNPARIGMSVVYDDEVVEAKQYELSCIIDEFRHKKLASSSVEAKYYQNKLVHETYEIAKKIAAIAAHHKCKYVFIEQLQFLPFLQISIQAQDKYQIIIPVMQHLVP